MDKSGIGCLYLFLLGGKLRWGNLLFSLMWLRTIINNIEQHAQNQGHTLLQSAREV